MIARELTESPSAARTPGVTLLGSTGLQRQGQGSGRRAASAGFDVLAMAGLLAGTLSGCVNVAAPDKPIVVELNINIRHEVVYRLDGEAAKTIEDNRDIF